MPIVILHLGTNMGDKEQNILNAYNAIEDRIGTIRKKSSFHITEAWGIKDQGDFINSAVEIETSHSPFEVLLRCNIIEIELGRERALKWGPRIIDIDIIFYDDLKLQSSILTLPHPFYHLRSFVLDPLSDIGY